LFQKRVMKKVMGRGESVKKLSAVLPEGVESDMAKIARLEMEKEAEKRGRAEEKKGRDEAVAELERAKKIT